MRENERERERERERIREWRSLWYRWINRQGSERFIRERVVREEWRARYTNNARAGQGVDAVWECRVCEWGLSG